MNAETLSTAVAYEKQALARVRRVGQERSEVHVWRFVTRETVEEHMHQFLSLTRFFLVSFWWVWDLFGQMNVVIVICTYI